MCVLPIKTVYNASTNVPATVVEMELRNFTLKYFCFKLTADSGEGRKSSASNFQALNSQPS
jgi:hypothetical protein